MRRLVLFSIAAVVIAACSSETSRTPTQPESITLPVTITSAQQGGQPSDHSVHLSGDNEVFSGAPSPADSNAQGQATFQIAPDEQSFTYKLIVANIDNVVQAHIHCGPVGVNGPIVVWLFPDPSASAALQGPTGPHDGVLAEGTVNNTVDPPATNHVTPTTNPNCPGGIASFADVLARIREGNAYVNVHTSDGVPPNNEGPGDFPGGEVRGQFKSR
jgi:CHRD domain-containing protein